MAVVGRNVVARWGTEERICSSYHHKVRVLGVLREMGILVKKKVKGKGKLKSKREKKY